MEVDGAARAAEPHGGGLSQPVLVGSSAAFAQVLTLADSVAAKECVVLLEGESGTGKELLARRIHSHSPRRGGPFIPANCPGISETLFESQFYGHLKGAFTGANSDTLGIVRAADGGTLLLDEIGEMPVHLQPKLLRLIQEREVTPVGASQPMPVNVRFVAATNRSLAKCVAEGTFRRDLFHRLNVVRIVVPPLRSRPQDVDDLLDFFLESYARHYCMAPRVVGPLLRERLRAYPWLGNVRELSGYVERLYATNLPPMPPTGDTWEDGYAPSGPPAGPDGRVPITLDDSPLCLTLAQAEAQAIRSALGLAGQNRTATARLLGIHRSTLLRKLRALGID